MFKFLLALCLPALGLTANHHQPPAQHLVITTSLTGTALEGFTQLGNTVGCLTDATADAALGASGGNMDFLSDSLEMCAIACNCRQGCISFNWVKPDTFDGELTFVLPVDTESVGNQGKCTLRSSNCEGAFVEAADATVYAFQRTDKNATDVQSLYLRASASAAGEKEVTNQVQCVLQTVTADSGYRAIGQGGPGAGICASGGRYAKLSDLDVKAPAGTGLSNCITLCDGDSECSLFNLLPDGSCKFRNQCCETEWSAETAKKGWTSYAKDACAAMSTAAPTGSPTVPGSPLSPTATTSFSRATTRAGLAPVALGLFVASLVHDFH